MYHCIGNIGFPSLDDETPADVLLPPRLLPTEFRLAPSQLPKDGPLPLKLLQSEGLLPVSPKLADMGQASEKLTDNIRFPSLEDETPTKVPLPLSPLPTNVFGLNDVLQPTDVSVPRHLPTTEVPLPVSLMSLQILLPTDVPLLGLSGVASLTYPEEGTDGQAMKRKQKSKLKATASNRKRNIKQIKYTAFAEAHQPLSSKQAEMGQTSEK